MIVDTKSIIDELDQAIKMHESGPECYNYPIYLVPPIFTQALVEYSRESSVMMCMHIQYKHKIIIGSSVPYILPIQDHVAAKILMEDNFRYIDSILELQGLKGDNNEV